MQIEPHNWEEDNKCHEQDIELGVRALIHRSPSTCSTLIADWTP